MVPKDFHNRPFAAGDVIAVAMTQGSSGAVLRQRFVREVHPTHLVVQPAPEEPEDRRQIGRVTNFRNAIIIT